MSEIETPYTVIVDSREKLPYEFQKSMQASLYAGDYSIEGLEQVIAIERKSKNDMYSTIGQHRERFVRELEKLSKYQYSAVVIESTLKGFTIQPEYSRLHPNSAMASLLAWSIRYQIHVHFAGDRALGNKLTIDLLNRFWRHING